MVAKRLISDDGRTDLKNSSSNAASSVPLCAQFRDENLDAFRVSRACEDAIDGYAGISKAFCDASRDGDLCRLGHAAVDHFDGNLYRRLARNEEDSSPISLPHSRDVVAGKAHSAHHVRFEDAQPVFIGDLLEGLGFERPHVVDEDVDRRHSLSQLHTSMDLQLNNKRAVATGSTAGIGFAIAEGLAREDASVVVNGRTEKRVDAAIQEIRKTHPNANLTGAAADVSNAAGSGAGRELPATKVASQASTSTLKSRIGPRSGLSRFERFRRFSRRGRGAIDRQESK